MSIQHGINEIASELLDKTLNELLATFDFEVRFIARERHNPDINYTYGYADATMNAIVTLGKLYGKRARESEAYQRIYTFNRAEDYVLKYPNPFKTDSNGHIISQ